MSCQTHLVQLETVLAYTLYVFKIKRQRHSYFHRSHHVLLPVSIYVQAFNMRFMTSFNRFWLKSRTGQW